MAARRRPLTESDRLIGEQLAEWGKVALVETIGRKSGLPVTAAVGFIEEDDGSLLVSAGADEADWALNLLANRDCRATVGERVRAYRAQQLDNEARASAITRLILKYGTPAERLGRGPAFRLKPQAP